jgi:hypothetical protein
MKSPVLSEFPIDVIQSEARIRGNYLEKSYLQDVTSQVADGLFSKMIGLLYLRKISAHGKGRSRLAAKDFIRRMETRAKYTGRAFNGEVRPKCCMLDDPVVTYFPPEKSVILLISGSGETESVVQKSEGCLHLGIDTIAFSYEPRSVVAKCSTVYHHIPKKINSSVRGTLDTMGNSFETAAMISGWSLVEGLVDYHKNHNLEQASEVCLKYTTDCIKYVNHLGKTLPSMKKELVELGEMLSTKRDIRMAASGDNAASLQMGMGRIVHTERTGFDASIDFIGSDDFGPPGYSDIQSCDGVIISSSELGSSHTIAIAREATKIGAKLCLITSDKLSDELLKEKLQKYEIKMPEIVLRLPYSLPGSEERLIDLGVRHVLEYEAAGVFAYLGLTAEEVEATHLQKELE